MGENKRNALLKGFKQEKNKTLNKNKKQVMINLNILNCQVVLMQLVMCICKRLVKNNAKHVNNFELQLNGSMAININVNWVVFRNLCFKYTYWHNLKSKAFTWTISKMFYSVLISLVNIVRSKSNHSPCIKPFDKAILFINKPVTSRY